MEETKETFAIKNIEIMHSNTMMDLKKSDGKSFWIHIEGFTILGKIYGILIWREVRNAVIRRQKEETYLLSPGLFSTVNIIDILPRKTFVKLLNKVKQHNVLTIKL